MTAGGRVKISVKLDGDLVSWLDAQIEDKRRRGLKSDRSDQVRVALRQRQISKLPPEQRERLFAKLGVVKKED